jgi:hypothetical protein
MTKLLEKEAKFKWSLQYEESFLTLNKLLTTASILEDRKMVVSLLMLYDSFDAMKNTTPPMS